MRTRIVLCSLLVLANAPGALLRAQTRRVADAKITVAVGQPGHPISPTLFGVFFEGINLSADRGLYPELVRIEIIANEMGWKPSSETDAGDRG